MDKRENLSKNAKIGGNFEKKKEKRRKFWKKERKKDKIRGNGRNKEQLKKWIKTHSLTVRLTLTQKL